MGFNSGFKGLKTESNKIDDSLHEELYTSPAYLIPCKKKK